MGLNRGNNKSIDRTPNILPAGRVIENFGDSVANCLKEYGIDDAKQALRYQANIPQKEDNTYKYPLEPFKNNIKKGIWTEIRPILRPPVLTRYQTVVNELKETSYESHWNKVLGKTRDPVPGLPKGFNVLGTTFGKATDKEESVKLLVNPPKGVYEVLTESQVGHELYKKTHNDYKAGEKVERNYLVPPYEPNKRFGAHTKYDPRGIWVRCACHWEKSQPVVYSNKIQADFLERSRHKLGEGLAPNKIMDTFSPDMVFGKPPKQDMYGMEDLLKDGNCPPCKFKRDLKCWLSYFNKLKLVLKNRCNKDFSFSDLYKRLAYYDEERTDELPLKIFYAVCSCYKIDLDSAKLDPLLQLLSIADCDKINYRMFLDVLDYKKSPMDIIKIDDLPKGNQYYVTSTSAASCDYLIINNANNIAAGVPSIRHDLARPIVPQGCSRADLENLGEETSSAILINPSIYMNYGVSFRDFFLPMEKNKIRKLFEKVGHILDDNNFDKLWEIGLDQDKTGFVCVDTFKRLLTEYYPEHRKLIVDEATC